MSLSEQILATIVNDHGFITKRGLTVFPGSLLLITTPQETLLALSAADDAAPNTSPLNQLFAADRRPVLRHLMSVVRVLQLQATNQEDRATLDTESHMVQAADVIRRFIYVCLHSPELLACVNWHAVAYVINAIEQREQRSVFDNAYPQISPPTLFRHST